MIAGRSHRAAAESAVAVLRAELWAGASIANPSQHALHRYRDGERAIVRYSEVTPTCSTVVLELVRGHARSVRLECAIDSPGRAGRQFWDDAGRRAASARTGDVRASILRLKEDYDGAEPAARSVSVLNLLALESLVGGGVYGIAKAERTLARFGPKVGAAARVVPMMLAGLSAWHADHTQIVIVGPADREDTRALQREVALRYRPFAAVVPVRPGPTQQALSTLMPFVGQMHMQITRTYICPRDFTCREARDQLAAGGAAVKSPKDSTDGLAEEANAIHRRNHPART